VVLVFFPGVAVIELLEVLVDVSPLPMPGLSLQYCTVVQQFIYITCFVSAYCKYIEFTGNYLIETITNLEFSVYRVF
jgi:hypothetical protein